MSCTASTRLLTAVLIAVAVGRMANHAGAASWFMQANLTEAAYDNALNFDLPAGYRVVSVNAHGPTNDPRFAFVAIPDAGSPWQAWHGWDSDTYESEGQDLVDQGFRLAAVDAYGTYPNERYVTAWVDDGLPDSDWVSHHRMTLDDLEDQHTTHTNAGFRMIWLSAVGTTNDNLRFTAIWKNNTEGWSSDVSWNLSADGYQTVVEDLAKSGFRPTCVSVYGTDNNPVFAAIFHRPDGPNWEIQPNWEAKHEQTGPQFDDFADNATGYTPICAVGYGPVNDPRYAHTWYQKTGTPVFSATGQTHPSLNLFDTAMENFMVLRKISRGVLAVTVDERLIYSRGFTYAAANASLTQPDSRFRIASISKPITSAAIMQLVESAENTLGLDTKLVDIPGFAGDGWDNVQNADDITIRHLLQHRGGFNSDGNDNDSSTFDPMFRDALVATDQDVDLPVSTTDIVEYMKAFQLPFLPGYMAQQPGEVDYAYSNFGYSLLGRVIEAISGQDYETYVLENVLCPLGAGGMRIGGSLIGEALPGEVRYRDPMNRLATSVIDGETLVPMPYGGYNVRNFDSHGGWVGSAVDVARFASAFTDPANCPILTEDSIIDTLWNATPQSGDRYGAGWKQDNANTHWYHNGTLVGSYGYIIRRPDGVTMSVLFNQTTNFTNCPQNGTDGQIKTDLMAAADAIGNDPFGWPGDDLFDDGETCDPSTEPIPGDTTGDGSVDVEDLLLVILNWGCGTATGGACAGDANLDGQVDVADLILVILNWS